MAKGNKIPASRKAKLGFHGTDYDFEGFVLPNRVVGHRHFPISGAEDTYFLPADGSPASQKENESGAWDWASPEYGESKGGARPRVHVTRPIGQQHSDRNLTYGALPESDNVLKRQAAVAPAQEILDTRWAPPAGEGVSHVSQTLPHINWNQFNAPNWTTTLPPTNGHPERVMDQTAPQQVDNAVYIRQNYPPAPKEEAPPTTRSELSGQQQLNL